ncbi:hypothetical protein [Alkalimarinus coralli]|uniref:hypothetical protein n=1 Tax=Alkalimarinus coralli TaxID=2935863 RepID=UPI00202B01D8|nr:hypothetical protein [Alkalimarinus coralli]
MISKQSVAAVNRLIGIWLMLIFSSQVAAYSYSEAGKEPFIEGREALIGAMLAGDQKAAQGVVDGLEKELTELEHAMSIKVVGPLREGVRNNQRSTVISAMNSVFAAEIKRRLNMAEANINDYQKSKVLVAKSKRFLDTIVVELDDDEAETAEQSIKRCLKSIGNPGVFGAGAVPADIEQFKKAKRSLFDSLSTFDLSRTK